ncbi:hypothetical protein [Bacteroides clarus]|uniref:hypothetical protein n=1 Tax=Bacteroides clarus TaxID=626929 RepID=UPI003FEDDE9E
MTTRNNIRQTALLFQPAKFAPCLFGLSKAVPLRVSAKIILAPLAVFFRKALHNPARNGMAGKK